jgi:hypothetical protein
MKENSYFLVLFVGFKRHGADVQSTHPLGFHLPLDKIEAPGPRRQGQVYFVAIP